MRKKSIVFIIIILISIFTYSFGNTLNSDQSLGSISTTISQLDQEEIQILESLFLIQQEVRDLEITAERTSKEIQELSLKIENIEEDIVSLEASYNNNLDILEEILLTYQKKGPLSNLQLILSSDNLSTLLNRINSIRDLSRNTNKLLLTIEDNKQELSYVKKTLDDNLKEIQKRQAELIRTLGEKTATIANLEESLLALQDEKSRYEGYLSQLGDSWDKVKPVFLETIKGITETVENGDLPESILNIEFSFSGITGKIFDEELNQELSKKSYPTPPMLLFQRDKVNLVMSDLNLIINGNLTLLDNKTLRFEITDGEYLGLALEKSAVMDLFDFGYLDLKFHKLLGKNTIRSINIEDGYMDLKIRPSLF